VHLVADAQGDRCGSAVAPAHGERVVRQAQVEGVLAVADAHVQLEALDVAVPAVALPVELGELLVALELADDAAVVEWHVHRAADVAPARDFLPRQAELRHELDAAHEREQVQHIQRPAQHPHRHHVRIGVVVQSGAGASGYASWNSSGPTTPRMT
jgi:hypothetical protein